MAFFYSWMWAEKKRLVKQRLCSNCKINPSWNCCDIWKNLDKTSLCNPPFSPPLPIFLFQHIPVEGNSWFFLRLKVPKYRKKGRPWDASTLTGRLDWTVCRGFENSNPILVCKLNYTRGSSSRNLGTDFQRHIWKLSPQIPSTSNTSRVPDQPFKPLIFNHSTTVNFHYGEESLSIAIYYLTRVTKIFFAYYFWQWHQIL